MGLSNSSEACSKQAFQITPESFKHGKPIQFKEETEIDLKIIRQVHDGKFPIFLANSTTTNKQYAIKLYPYEEGKPSYLFDNEIKFSKLKHPHIIAPFHWEEKRVIRESQTQNNQHFSLTVMQYSPFGDFYSAFMEKKVRFNEKLARSYFNQLIEALSFIHKSGCSHLDLKLENLVFGSQFELKIIDFDMSFDIRTHKQQISIGTPNWRAPEMIDGERCKDLRKCDVYSAGIILFAFITSGRFPFIELHGEQLRDPRYVKVKNLRKQFNENSEEFWKYHSRRGIQFSSELKDLLLGICEENPDKRFTLSQVQQSAWVNGETLKQNEIKEFISAQFQ